MMFSIQLIIASLIFICCVLGIILILIIQDRNYQRDMRKHDEMGRKIQDAEDKK